MQTSDFDYFLPQELIAQTPIEPRSQSRLMVVNRSDGSLEHHRFFEIIDYLREGDVLVFNNSLVIPARLKGRRGANEGKVEILLLRRLSLNLWETLVKPARRIKVGTVIEITGNPGITVTAETVSAGDGGSRVMKFSDEKLLPELGEIPLPPYIRTPLTDPSRYQTVYADVAGSVAAPTAGLHFTPELIDKIRAKGVRCLFTTLHIGLDTFQPVREDDPLEHKIHKEYGVLSQEVAEELSKARREGRRIICVGTTATRLVEAAAQASSPDEIQPFNGWVDLFILPGHRFRVVDALITNFHLPRSTLLMLVTAFGGKELIDKAYREAIARQYRFYSFGDAMLII
ncbi:MAG: tRNA preQ1(34) S-adenosylmethionine ribosyltransferase-isomerase QueA [Chloroflexi bacterium RBG_16_50_9]|nr:MAG: tRNA preQ1(34) S-adenosylmethionine ribosyltransferase-isomerase QueA [Chloroflexi bacterium RBG_16_50_9]